MRLNLALALFLFAISAGCTETDDAPETSETAPPEEAGEVVVFPVEAPLEAEENTRTIANAPRRCDEEPVLSAMDLPASLRVSRDRRSLALLQIEAGTIHVTPADDADAVALAELRALVRQAETEGEVTYRFVRRPDRGGNGGENCLATTTRQSARFPLAFAHYLRSYDFRWMWDPAYYPR